MAFTIEDFGPRWERINNKQQSIKANQTAREERISRLQRELAQHRADFAAGEVELQEVNQEFKDLLLQYQSGYLANDRLGPLYASRGVPNTPNALQKGNSPKTIDASDADETAFDNGDDQTPMHHDLLRLKAEAIFPPLHKDFAMVGMIDGQAMAIACGTCGANAKSSGPFLFLDGLKGLKYHLERSHEREGITLEEGFAECTRTPISMGDAQLIRNGQVPSAPIKMSKGGLHNSGKQGRTMSRKPRRKRPSNQSVGDTKIKRFEVLDRGDHQNAVFADNCWNHVSCNMCGANARIKHQGAAFFSGLLGLAGHYRSAHEKADGTPWSNEEVYQMCKKELVDDAIVERVRKGDQVPATTSMNFGPEIWNVMSAVHKESAGQSYGPDNPFSRPVAVAEKRASSSGSSALSTNAFPTRHTAEQSATFDGLPVPQQHETNQLRDRLQWTAIVRSVSPKPRQEADDTGEDYMPSTLDDFSLHKRRRTTDYQPGDDEHRKRGKSMYGL